MSKLCDWLRGHGFGPSAEVRRAVEGSRRRQREASEYRGEAAERAEPLREALGRNHFEDSIGAIFERARKGAA